MIDLKLDTHAVRQLFPEGSAMRVALQQSVINNIVKELVVKDSKNKITEAVKSEIAFQGSNIPNVEDAVRKELEKFFERNGWNVKGTVELKRVMKEEAERIAHEQLLDSLVSSVDAAAKRMENYIADAIKINERQYEEMIVSRLNESFSEIIDKAIAAKLAQVFPVEVK
ncbi:hypothetical protein LG358_00182 [Escherichia phage UoN_LG358_1]|nr:hypothetical protein LG358_00182 [Escherichia phage UoN_LG358_1]